MSHYGYVTEQLISEQLFPKKGPRRRRRKRSPRPAPAVAERPEELATDAVASTRPPRVVVALVRRLAPW